MTKLNIFKLLKKEMLHTFIFEWMLYWFVLKNKGFHNISDKATFKAADFVKPGKYFRHSGN